VKALDPLVVQATLTSVRVATTALLCALAVGVPAGAALATARGRLGRALETLAGAGMGLPPVLVGLVVSLLLWRSGPLGALGLMYSVTAMVVAQTIIALPIVTALAAAALRQLGPAVPQQLLGLGATPWQMRVALVRQARVPLVAVALAAGGRLLGEVGAVMMVGGNIAGETRVLTTALLLEVRQGEFERALWLGAVLLALSVGVSWGLARLGHREAAP
jgi:tungstate transport system permease protein